MAHPEAERSEPAKKKARKAKMGAPQPQELPTPTAVQKARKADLVKWLDEFGEKTEGRVADLRARLLDYVSEHGKAPEPAEPVAGAAPGEALAGEAEIVATPAEAAPEAEVPSAEEPEEPEPQKARKREATAGEYRAKKKPVLEDATRRALEIRREIASRRPRFLRQEWYRYSRLGEIWRRPQGGQSKLRRHFGSRGNVVSIGYRSPRRSRGLHPSGFEEVLVHTPRELDGTDPKRQAIRIAHGVGFRKRRIIQEEAAKRGLRVLNPVEVEA